MFDFKLDIFPSRAALKGMVYILWLFWHWKTSSSCPG